MKKIPTLGLTLAAASFVVVGFAATNALANEEEFSGSIAFGASGVTVNNSDLADATSFSVSGAFTTTDSGEYATLGVGAFHPVEFTGFTFNPPVSSVDPLWLFNLGTTVFSFDATSVHSTWVPGVGAVGEWVITGDGTASITGFADTPGTYTINLSQSGDMTIGFDSTASVSAPPGTVPDGGNTVTLLGSALATMGVFGRRKIFG